jgi:transposase
MRKAIPSITEHAAGLKQRLRREQDSHKQLRLQMLYLLASQQTHERQEAAQLLGVHRNTIGGWLAIYVAGGLAALLATHAPPGRPVSLASDVLTSLEQALRRQGLASYEALRQWVARTHGVQIKYKTLYTLVRTRFRTKLKVPRPSHTKNLRRCRCFKPPAMRNSSVSFPQRTAAPCGSSVRMKAALAC